MDNNRFFKFIWRANGLLVFGLAVIAAFFTLFIAGLTIVEFGSSGNSAPPPAVEVRTDAEIVADTFRLEIPHSPIVVDNFTYIELRAGVPSGGKFSSGGYSRGQLRNIGIFDMNTNTTKWVFNGSQQEIESRKQIAHRVPAPNDEYTETITGLLLTVATSRADKTVQRDIWIMSPDGEDLRKVIPNMTGDLELQRYDNTRLKLMIEQDDQIDVYDLDTAALTLGEPTTITLP